MRVLVTGDKGYIGSVLISVLTEAGYQVSGLDSGLFADCLLFEPANAYSSNSKDIRDVVIEDLVNVDAIIHLAALSNDPLGELAPGLTEEINFASTIRFAKLARAAGVSRFIYASSQSMYGLSDSSVELDEDNSEKNPITAYAKTKWLAECALKDLGTNSFAVVCFRPSTVFGVSPRLRCDIVFNNLVACAHTTGKIEIKSDGTPWRPVVHVRDVCQAFTAGLIAPREIVSGKSYNVGIPDGNFTVRELAEAAQRAVPGSSLTFTCEHGNDARTYRVSFRKILSELKDFYKPEWDLDRGGRELVDLFKRINFNEADFRGGRCNRLAHLQYLQSSLKLDSRMRKL